MSMYTQETLDSLRNARSRFYETSRNDLQALSLMDQKKHADNMHRIVQQMMHVELVMTTGGNGELKKYESQLKKAAANLEAMCADETNLLLLIRSVNHGLGALDEIIELVR